MRNNNEIRLKIAVQKSGRLSDSSFSLLKKCGLNIKFSNRELICKVKNFPIDILQVRDDDILTLVKTGVCDLGIVGDNVIQENSKNETAVNNVMSASNNGVDNKVYKHIVEEKLGFSKCRLSLAVLKNSNINSINDLNNKNIATSYPFLLQKFLQSKKINANIVVMKGAVEIAPQLGVSEAICDLVSSGATLEANSLLELDAIFKSEAVLISNKFKCEDKTVLIERLKNRIKGVLRAKENKYIMLNAPRDKLQEITKLLHANMSPTIMPLENKDHVAVHVVCKENIFWETVESLEKAGANSILVVPIEKMML